MPLHLCWHLGTQLQNSALCADSVHAVLESRMSALVAEIKATQHRGPLLHKGEDTAVPNVCMFRHLRVKTPLQFNILAHSWQRGHGCMWADGTYMHVVMYRRHDAMML